MDKRSLRGGQGGRCVQQGEPGGVDAQPTVEVGGLKNGIAVHAWPNQHQVNWEAASVRQEERGYWSRRVLEALHIHQQHQTSNLDCGLSINPSWLTNLPFIF